MYTYMGGIIQFSGWTLRFSGWEFVNFNKELHVPWFEPNLESSWKPTYTIHWFGSGSSVNSRVFGRIHLLRWAIVETNRYGDGLLVPEIDDEGGVGVEGESGEEMRGSEEDRGTVQKLQKYMADRTADCRRSEQTLHYHNSSLARHRDEVTASRQFCQLLRLNQLTYASHKARYRLKVYCVWLHLRKNLRLATWTNGIVQKLPSV